MALPFTAEDIAAAYRETGMKPIRSRLIARSPGDDSPYCGCGIGVLYAKHLGSAEAMLALAEKVQLIPREIYTSLGITWMQMNGLTEGFDGRSPFWSNPDYLEAHRVGREAARLVGLETSDGG